MNMSFSQTHTGDLARRLCKLTDKLVIAEQNNDLEAIAEHENNLKSCAMELIATLDFQGQDTDIAKQAIEHALTQVQRVATAMYDKQSEFTKRAQRDRHIRLVYTKDR